jgi:hypothetical protein
LALSVDNVAGSLRVRQQFSSIDDDFCTGGSWIDASTRRPAAPRRWSREAEEARGDRDLWLVTALFAAAQLARPVPMIRRRS